MYAHIQTDRGEVKSLSPLLINTIWSVLNASKHEKRKRRERERERERETARKATLSFRIPQILLQAASE